ncbi:MAG: NAD(P)H-hydrate dehydratase [Lentisphaeria bacterium]|nr:NAD(P)H-hydrate dehydratase [Lentisphaeria bacterium]
MRSADTETIRRLERAAVADGTPEYTLMLRAGAGAAAWIARRFARADRFVVLAGGGNNGGDALVAAAELHRRRFPVCVFGTQAKSAYRGSAAQAAAELPSGIPWEVRDSLTAADFRPGDVIVDGLLGIGFAGGGLKPKVRSFIAAANASGCPAIALDLPSGVGGDDGVASSDGAVRATVTLTFGRPKTGLFRHDGAVLRGALRVIDIGLPREDEGAGEEIFTNLDAVRRIPRRPVDIHKNQRGRVLIWGGGPEYSGAPALAAAAAMYGGAGVVRAASEAYLRVPNGAIVRRLRSGESPEDWFPDSDVMVCGCGWGSCGTAEHLRTAWQFPGTLVLDADGLNALARHAEVWSPRRDVIVTPHPGEAAGLEKAFGLPGTAERGERAVLLARKLAAVVVLKGRDTVIAAPDGSRRIAAAGSAALATAGSGDVLAGTIGALAAQPGMTAADAAALGVYLHGIAGENAPGTLIADELPRLIGSTARDVRDNANF